MRGLRQRLAPLMAGTIVALTGTANAQDEFASDARRLIPAIQLHVGQTVADIGAGAGQLTVELAREVGASGRVYATELEEDRRRDIREAVNAAGLKNVEVLEAKATSTNLPDGCCDALVMRRVYHHIGNPGLMNESMLAALKPGGFLAIIDFPPDSAESADPNGRDEGEQHGVTSATVERELGEAGFDVVRVEKGEASNRYMVVARRPG